MLRLLTQARQIGVVVRVFRRAALSVVWNGPENVVSPGLLMVTTALPSVDLTLPVNSTGPAALIVIGPVAFPSSRIVELATVVAAAPVN